MNINRELKIIWWAPERCGTKITAEIFKKFNFEVFEQSTNVFFPLSENYHSHDIIFPEEFKDYTVICNVRNPYDRIISLYLNFTSLGKNFVWMKTKKPELKRKINLFCLELFEYGIKQKLIENIERKVPVRDYVSKLSFDGKLPDKLIKMENLYEDISSLDFVQQSKLWTSGELQELIEKNNFLRKNPFHFSDLYDWETAVRVFNYYKKHFFICDYDPFSFSQTPLTEDEKYKFIHEIL